LTPSPRSHRRTDGAPKDRTEAIAKALGATWHAPGEVAGRVLQSPSVVIGRVLGSLPPASRPSTPRNPMVRARRQ
jgi:hypothetical protein